MELDPVFVTALRLLHSKSKESGLQLKALLDESLRKKKAAAAAASSASPLNPAPPPSSGIPRESDKRNFEKLRRDLSELVDSPAKKPRLHPSPGRINKSHTPSPTPTPTPPSATGLAGDRLSGGNSSADEGDLDLEGLNDLNCCVCKNWSQGNGNKLMECHTCQDLYHQECHKPPISNEEAGDPRLVWNCSQCKVKNAPPAKIAPSGSKPSLKISGGLAGLKSRPGAVTSQSGGVFKRSDPPGKSLGSGSGGKPAGMAALAASYKGGASKGSSRSGSYGGHKGSGSSSGSSGSSSMNADKRLQMMKKKAAAQRKK